MLKVHPVAHLIGEVGPFFGVLHHLFTACGVVLINADLLAYVLLGDAQFLLNTELNGQTMGVPSRLALYLVALHRLVSAERVLDSTCQHVVYARHAVGRRGTLKEQERCMSLTDGYTLMEEIFLLPLTQHLTAQGS